MSTVAQCGDLIINTFLFLVEPKKCLMCFDWCINNTILNHRNKSQFIFKNTHDFRYIKQSSIHFRLLYSPPELIPTVCKNSSSAPSVTLIHEDRRGSTVWCGWRGVGVCGEPVFYAEPATNGSTPATQPTLYAKYKERTACRGRDLNRMMSCNNMDTMNAYQYLLLTVALR